VSKITIFFHRRFFLPPILATPDDFRRWQIDFQTEF
jgi:hypothetical protein